MKKKIYLAMLAVCFALTASACGDGGAVITDGTKTEGAADGKKAGMDVCMVGWGFRDEEFLKDNGAEFVVHSPEEAWEFINK